MVLAHPAFTEDQIESWSQPPASIMAKAPGKIFRMIVTIVKKYVEDGALNLSNLPLKAGSSIEVIILVQPASSADSNLYPPCVGNRSLSSSRLIRWLRKIGVPRSDFVRYLYLGLVDT